LRPVTLAWCPDSTCIIATDTRDETKPDALFAVSIDTGEKRQLTSSEGSHFADTDPAVSPDGRWLVFRRDVAPFSGSLQLLALRDHLTASGQPRAVTPILLSAYSPQWISDREFIFAAKGALWRMSTSEGSTPERLPFVGEDGLMPTPTRFNSRLSAPSLATPAGLTTAA
jgi:Tol biopolymer transport system component